MIEAVVFDLYGTLIYIHGSSKPTQRMFEELGLWTEEELAAAKDIALTQSFDNLAQLAEKVRPGCCIETETYELAVREEAGKTSLFPESLDVLECLKEKGLRIGLISNISSSYRRTFFDLGLAERVDEYILSCDVGVKKPDPKIYQSMSSKLKLPERSILMVGDSYRCDFVGPKKAGMQAVWLNRSHSTDSKKIISSLEGIYRSL